MIMAGRGRRLEKIKDDEIKVGSSPNSPERTSVELPSLINKIMEIDVNNLNHALLMTIQNIFKELFTTKEIMRDVISNLHSKALNDPNFAEKLALALEQVSHLEVDGTLVRGELLSHIQDDFKAKEAMVESNHKRFINSVVLLGNIYHRFKVCGSPIAILGIALLEYFDLLIKGDEEELRILTKQILINGEKLSLVKNYEVFTHNIRHTLMTKNLSSSSRCWILLAIDFMSNEFRPLKAALRDFYMKNLGVEYEKLEVLITTEDEKVVKSSICPDIIKRHDTTPTKSKKDNSSPNKTNGFKNDIFKKFSEMNVKSSNENKEKINLSPAKNKNEAWKLSEISRGISGHDDRFQKNENFYGTQKQRQLKSYQKKKCNDKFSRNENEDCKTDFSNLEPQQEIGENKFKN